MKPNVQGCCRDKMTVVVVLSSCEIFKTKDNIHALRDLLPFRRDIPPDICLRAATVTLSLALISFLLHSLSFPPFCVEKHLQVLPMKLLVIASELSYALIYTVAAVCHPEPPS